MPGKYPHTIGIGLMLCRVFVRYNYSVNFNNRYLIDVDGMNFV